MAKKPSNGRAWADVEEIAGTPTVSLYAYDGGEKVLVWLTPKKARALSDELLAAAEKVEDAVGDAKRAAKVEAAKPAVLERFRRVGVDRQSCRDKYETAAFNALLAEGKIRREGVSHYYRTVESAPAPSVSGG